VPSLLGRDLTSDERAVEAALRSALRQYGRVRVGRATVQQLAARQPELFFAAAITLLNSEADPVTCRNLYSTHPNRFGREDLLEVCRRLMAIDNFLDVRLARLAPGRQSDGCTLASATIVRVLDVLDQISPGPRLIVILNHLTRHPDQRIAAKATLLLARRVHNDSWVENHLASTDPRSRASVVEALWGANTVAARRIMWASLNDINNRVVGNAVLGLHLIGDQRAAGLVAKMIADPRPPFRWTAAWVMGRMGNPEFVPLLEQAACDPERGVQTSALRALDAIRKPVVLSKEEPAAGIQPQPAEGKPPVLEPVPVPSVPVTVANPEAVQSPPAGPKRTEEPEEAPTNFDLRLDGSYTSAGR
jgi:hypothetical protein